MSKKILIVDDAPFMRRMIRDVLEPFGFEIVAEAGDGDEAFEAYKTHHPDVVTLDIVMPRVSGIHALKMILDHDPRARVVMITAIDQREALMDAIRIGASDFIVKPFDEDRVLSAVRKAAQ